MINYKILLATLLLTGIIFAQQIPAAKQSKNIVITNATIHIGNGKVIENGSIAFENGKITQVSSTQIGSNSSTTEIIDAKGKHVYPGFIAPNSTLGLVEIDAVKSSDDEDEIGSFNPHIKSSIAYNAESKVIETVRPNGVLIAQITPRGGRISGTSSIVQLDAWNWKEAMIKENDGIHINFPVTFKKNGWWAEPGMSEVNKEYNKQIEELNSFFADCKAYNQAKPAERNLIFESTKGLFDGSQTLFINANNEKQIIDAVAFSKQNQIKKMVIVGGFEAYKVSGLLLENNISILLKRPHSMPEKEEQDVNLPYKMAKLLSDKGVLFALENSGDKERMNTRNLPFLAGSCAAFGLDKEVALQLITLNSAKILGIDATCGSLEVGKDATLFISDGDALDMRTNKLSKAFIQGRSISLENHQTDLNKKYKEKYGQK